MSRNHKSHGRKAHGDRSSKASDTGSGSLPVTRDGDSPSEGKWLILGGLVMVAALVWSYWPTLAEMVTQWRREPDYSHGFLVLPIAVFFLWSRRSSFPRGQLHPSLVGALILMVAVVFRVTAGLFYMQPLDGWTIPIWVVGSVWLLYGIHCLLWCLPSIIFLWFMVPLPYRAETWLSVPLQGVATKVSTAALQMLGQPALAEGHTILLGDHQLFVEEACSGLRILVGVSALAFAFVLFSKWSWWQKALVLVAVVPVSLIANITRIVVTGLLYQFVSDESAKHFSHDVSGLFMIPLAAMLLWLFLLYLERLFPEVEQVAPISGGHIGR